MEIGFCGLKTANPGSKIENRKSKTFNMGWFKRNLFFAIGVVVAIALLGAAAFYDYAGWGHNQTAFAKLNEVYNTLSELNKKKPLPGSGTVDNIAAAKEQESKLKQWIGQTKDYFQPIAPVPKATNGPVTDPLFAGALHRTIAQLQHEADTANVVLPPEFDFSFTAHVDRLTFAPGSLELLSVQLGEVKTISEILFGAGINALDGVQRCRVSPDDVSGPQTDYLEDQPVTADLAVLVPYQVTFRGFSPEIARVLKGFASSPHGFIVKTMIVQPAAAAATGPMIVGYQPAPEGGRRGYDAGVAPQPMAILPGKGGLPTVLDEQLLSVTLKVELVKLSPRN